MKTKIIKKKTKEQDLFLLNEMGLKGWMLDSMEYYINKKNVPEFKYTFSFSEKNINLKNSLFNVLESGFSIISDKNFITLEKCQKTNQYVLYENFEEEDVNATLIKKWDDVYSYFITCYIKNIQKEQEDNLDLPF